MEKILIVDDEDSFIKIAKKGFEDHGYEVIAAENGEEGLTKAKTEDPDLILLDVLMPKMDGYTMLREVKKNEEIKDIPIIMCSGKVTLKISENTLKSEADAYLAKPFDATVYISKIKELLKKPSLVDG